MEMRVEIRNDNEVEITGYVNAVERLSKPIRELQDGKLYEFREKVAAGVFADAISRNSEIPVLLNHDDKRLLANTGDGTAELKEDNIGLHATFRTSDPDVVQKAKEDRLSGWSFGFVRRQAEDVETDDLPERTLLEIDLLEVSLLDDDAEPAYYGTQVDKRSADAPGRIETRSTFAELAVAEQAAHDAVEKNSYQSIYEKHREISGEFDQKRAELFIDLFVERLVERFKEVFVVEKAEEGDDTRSIEKNTDYSDFENRITKIKE